MDWGINETVGSSDWFSVIVVETTVGKLVTPVWEGGGTGGDEVLISVTVSKSLQEKFIRAHENHVLPNFSSTNFWSSSTLFPSLENPMISASRRIKFPNPR